MSLHRHRLTTPPVLAPVVRNRDGPNGSFGLPLATYLCDRHGWADPTEVVRMSRECAPRPRGVVGYNGVGTSRLSYTSGVLRARGLRRSPEIKRGRPPEGVKFQ